MLMKLILVAGGGFISNFVIQIAAGVMIVRMVGGPGRRWLAQARLMGGVKTLSAVTFALLATFIVQLTIWAVIFEALGQFDDFETALYHSAVNFATLGYGDIVMQAPWRILGPLEAICGNLTLGIAVGALANALRVIQNTER
ncbi:ion channel [Niveibacterium sp.]|uniref:ion channel n=1 Tax=Niveibacterium sp. TaxID=2017444 RepID=UPI0035B2DAC6